MGIADAVNKKINSIYEERKIKLFALAQSYAGIAIKEARSTQGTGLGGGGVWTNQTGQAIASMFSKAFIDKKEIGFFLSHGKQYGIYLELANDRQREIIRPIITKLAPKFLADARRIF